MSAGIGSKAELLDYNSLKNKVDSIFGVGEGQSGYGQGITSSLIQPNSIISASNWQSLRNDMVKARQHQTGLIIGSSSVTDANNLILISSETLISETIRQQYELFSNAIIMDKNKVHSSQVTNQELANGHRTTRWTNSITHTVTINPSTNGDGASENLRYFFNAGGTITIQSSRAHGASTSINTAWTNFLNSAGTISLSALSTTKTGGNGTGSLIGFYNLTTTNQKIFYISTNGVSQYHTITWNVFARTNSNRSQIILTIEYLDTNTTGISSIDGDFYSTIKQNVPSGENVMVYPLSATHDGMDAIVAPVYSITCNNTVNEGSVFRFDVSCSDPGRKTLKWKFIGNVSSADFDQNLSALFGTVDLGDDGTGYVSGTVVSDNASEGTEQFYIQLLNTNDVVLATSGNVYINDTSSATYSYTITVNERTVYRGGTQYYYTINTNDTRGTTLYITLSGNITTSDVVGGLSSTLTIPASQTNVTSSYITGAKNTNAQNSSFVIQGRIDSPSGAIVVQSPLIQLANDPIVTPVYTYSVQADRYSVLEGHSVNYTITSSDNAIGTSLYITLSGSITTNSITGELNRTIPITSTSVSDTIVTLADTITETNEQFIIQCRTGSYTGPIVASTPSITIVQPQIQPTYNISVSQRDVIEGETVTFTVNTTSVPNGTILTYVILGSITDSDISGPRVGTITVNNNTATGSFVIATEGLSETAEILKVEIRPSTIGELLCYSPSITINPVVYNITATPRTVNEGETVSVTVTTSYVRNSTVLYYDIVGSISDSDIVGGRLGKPITINNNTGNGSFVVANDGISEGLEAFHLDLRSGSASGPIVARSPDVVINPKGSITFTSSDTFVVPVGVININVSAVGGGGAGGDGAGVDGSPQGGFAGKVVNSNIPVSPGNTVTVTIGRGGVGVKYSSGKSGGPGTASTVSVNGKVMLTAAGGAGGARVKGNMLGQSSGAPFNGAGGTSRWGASGTPGGVGAGGGGVDGKASGHFSGGGGRGEVRISW